MTICASPKSTSAVPSLVTGAGQGVASPHTPETKQSALSAPRPRPVDGLRRRTTARCDYAPVYLRDHAQLLTCFFIFSLVIPSRSATSFPSPNPPTLAQVLEPMSPIQLEFFNKLNAELSKVDSFFNEREAEDRARSLQLRGQLEELKDHRRLFHVTWSFIPSFARY